MTLIDLICTGAPLDHSAVTQAIQATAHHTAESLTVSSSHCLCSATG